MPNGWKQDGDMHHEKSLECYFKTHSLGCSRYFPNSAMTVGKVKRIANLKKYGDIN
jgi:hypothetical protein